MAMATNYYRHLLLKMCQEFAGQDEYITKPSSKDGVSKTPSVSISEKITESSWKSKKATEYAEEIKGMIQELETIWTNTEGQFWSDWRLEKIEVDDQGREAWKTKSDL